MSGLTKQHFKVIAEIINLTNKEFDLIERVALVNNISDYFKTQNPLFNENQFKKACLE